MVRAGCRSAPGRPKTAANRLGRSLGEPSAASWFKACRGFPTMMRAVVAAGFEALERGTMRSR
jgi:hypothetical protein